MLKTFLYAVKNHYWYQMYLDDLPIWGIVGEIEEKGQDFYIWTHKKFEIGWNGDQIVDVNLTSEGRTKLHLSTEKLEFTYEVSLAPLTFYLWSIFSSERLSGRSRTHSLRIGLTNISTQISSNIGSTGFPSSTVS